MKRSIIDYAKITPEIYKMLEEKFPDGYGDKDVIYFKGVDNATIEALQVEGNDIIYLVKLSPELDKKLNTSN
ncbi:hypothetical protein [Aureivirga sp. CE67]|uniref:hypothetical protein n=1 Tax=Aureivirga sp. CE67 TaxID=1788983 RepID=UPI0018CAF58C|nr:hypothetical protein [Aureivirga sp. CE67]